MSPYMLHLPVDPLQIFRLAISVSSELVVCAATESSKVASG